MTKETGRDDHYRSLGVAFVSGVGEHGCLAEVMDVLDSCEPTQDSALADVERKLEQALRDVRSLRVAIASSTSGDGMTKSEDK